tara:strand:- start:82 stop:696 length:615 start_codon:yes stop_codon:yes gene_type:complete
MPYTFRSFRKPHISKIREVTEGTIELRKLMGWSGQGGITTPFTNIVSLVTHFKRFESMKEIDEHLEKMSSNKQVRNKINDLNSHCDAYVNTIFEILRPASGPYFDNMKNNKYIIQYWMKPKIGKRWDLADTVIKNSAGRNGNKPQVSVPIGSMEAGDLVVSLPFPSLSDLPTFEESKSNIPLLESVEEFLIEPPKRHITTLIFD